MQKQRWIKGELHQPPTKIGANNNFATTYICIDHNKNKRYKIVGGIKDFCEEHNISYTYVKKYKNKGKINLKIHGRMRRKALNTIGWEFIQ